MLSPNVHKKDPVKKKITPQVKILLQKAHGAYLCISAPKIGNKG